MIDYALSTEYCEEVNASRPNTALCRVWSAAGGIAAERKLQTKIKECEGTAMKKAISLLLVIVMTTIALAGCGSKSENPAGNADSNQPADESITIKNSPDKYTWYIKNYPMPGWRVMHRPDMFPHTQRYDLFPCTMDIQTIVSTHIETVCLLTHS